MNAISISVDAYLTRMFCHHWEEVTPSILKHLAKSVNYNLVPERFIVEVEEIRKVVRWERIDKMKLIRILIRCLDQNVDILDKVNLKKFNYKVKDLTYLLMRRPAYIEHFPIDLNKIKTSEAATVLSLGHEYFLDKVDFSKYKFNFKESMNIIQGYQYDREIIKKVNYKALKGYQISEIFIHTGEENMDLLDASTLSNIDWLNLLEVRPDMLKHCDFNKFKRSDIFYSIRLCCMFDTPDLSHLVLERDLEEISPFGWEKLLIEKPGTFLAHCNFSKLDDNNWNNILKDNPELHVYKLN